MEKSRDIAKLLEIMAALRAPGTGCPWDLEQSFATIAPYTIEEAYEVADAIARGDLADLKEELGDLLLQVVFHARMAEEIGAFDFGDVVDAITDKLIRRHPHVFGVLGGLSAEEVKGLWAKIKAEEKAGRNAAAGPGEARAAGLLSDVPIALPGLTRAVKLQSKAANIGFDWDDARLVLAKIREETDEIEAALESKDAGAIVDEIGDLLFAIANLARHVGADPEAAIRRTNQKFARRFGHIEREIARRGGKPASLAEMDALWNEAKQGEK
jgi:nucleoside triphosphate diphosphatase